MMPLTQCGEGVLLVMTLGGVGMKETNKVDYDWVAPDKADLQVYVVREETNSANAYFQLTSSELGIDLTSSIFPDVYENERWVLAAKVRNPAIDTDEDYFLDFQGVNSDGETIQNSHKHEKSHMSKHERE